MKVGDRVLAVLDSKYRRGETGRIIRIYSSTTYYPFTVKWDNDIDDFQFACNEDELISIEGMSENKIEFLKLLYK